MYKKKKDESKTSHLSPTRRLFSYQNLNSFTMPTGTLDVVIVEGRHLKDRDLLGQNDAYVEVYLNKNHKQRTTTVSNSNNPLWHARCIFNVEEKDDTIHFDVYDSDMSGRDSIGTGKLKLKHVFDGSKFDDWVKLPAKLGLTSHGEIHVIMNFTVSYFI
jgi:Ca2+-dependent lipid-binding protein